MRTNNLFVGWNTAANGSGAPFTTATAVNADMTVYAQWERLPPGALSAVILNPITREAPLTPMEYNTYSERSDMFIVKVAGFNVAHVELDIDYPEGLSLSDTSVVEEGVKIFSCTVSYDGQTAFPEGFASTACSMCRRGLL